MAKELPYFRWFPKDAEADAKYAAMSLAELGLFHRCLNASWTNDGLPTNPEEIARVLRIPVKEFAKLWPRVVVCFSGQERLYNSRQEIERTRAISKSEQASDAVRRRRDRSTSDDTDVHTDDSSSDHIRPFESDSEGSVFDLKQKRKPSMQAESDQWFDGVFWPSWPVKENKARGKADARKIKPDERDAVIAGLRLQSVKIASMERPIHASTWINNRRWEDDPKAVESAIARNGTGSLFQNVPDRLVRRNENNMLTKMALGEK
jgi:uncharacterized protein YdaU (DUF1376 family)